MEKVMILGAGPLQVPAIRKAKDAGFYVIACDYDPQAVGFEFADEFYIISTIDKDKILDKAKELNVNYVITSTSDAPVRTAAYVSELLGLYTGISYKDSICATIKSAMRERLENFGVPIPKFKICQNYEEYILGLNELECNCVIKPSDNAASRGVMQVNNRLSNDEIKRIYNFAKDNSKNGIVVLEEYMSGQEVSVECFIENGIVDIITITDKMITELPYFVELGHSEPSSLDEEIQCNIKKVAEKAIHSIGIVNGVAHVEIKVTEEGPKIVEIAARLGGDMITSKLVPLSTGVDMVGNSILLSLGKPIKINKTKQRGSAIRFFYAEDGIVNDIVIDDSIKNLSNIVELVITAKVGDQVHSLKSSNDRLGYVITTGNNSLEAVRTAEEAVKKVKFIMKK